MKNNNLFNKVLSYICIILFLSIFILFVLGRFNRVGYLSDFKLINEVNGVYNYNFRISYYSKIFRNSDIYDVYINTNEVIKNNNFIKDISFLEKGSPFGSLTSFKEISEEKINDVEYHLNIKFPIFIIFIASLILFFINPNVKEIISYIINFFNKRQKLILKIYLILIVSVLFIFILLFLLSRINHKGTLENFELIAESKAGYVYKAKLKSKGLFSPNLIYEYSDKSLILENKPDYIKNYGYSIEINRMPDWYNTSPEKNITASAWNNGDGTFTISNSISWNSYIYIIPLSVGEKYRTSIEIKRLSNYSEGYITYYLDIKNYNIYIPNTENITSEYKVYSGEIEIKEVLTNEYPNLYFSYPMGIFNIKSIKIEQISDNLYLKNNNEIIFTLTKNINNIQTINNVKYYVKLKYSVFIKLLFIIILLGIFIYILRDLIFYLSQSSSILITHITNINRYSYILIIFLCFLIMPNIIYKVFYDKFDHTNYENRVLSIKPVLDIKHLDEYPKEYETYFSDYIPFRNELVKLKNILDITIFNNLTSKDLLLGKDKWLFLKWYPLVEDYIGNYKYYDQELKNAKDNLLKLEKIIKDKNIDFYLMICPDKNKIYPEYMPDYIKRIHPEYNSTDKLIEYLRKNYDIKIVYPKKELLKYKESDLLYYKYDAHWNRLGAYIGYIELMKAMNKDYIDLKDINIIRNDMGTPIYKLANMISLSESKYKYDTEYSVSNFTTNNYLLVNKYNTNATTIEHFNSDSPDKRRIVVLRDSFSEAMLDYISSNFYEVIFISIAYDDINVLDYAIKLKPDIIIYQSVERYLKYRLLNILPTYSLPN